MADMITCCPQCAAAFRITTTHLTSAKGAVRCGSCFTVFNALEHLAQTKTTSPYSFDPDDMLISDTQGIEDEDEPDHPSAHHSDKTPKQQAFARAAAMAKRKAEEAEPDESWALNLLDAEDLDLDELPHTDDEDLIETSPHWARLTRQSQPLDLSEDFLSATGSKAPALSSVPPEPPEPPKPPTPTPADGVEAAPPTPQPPLPEAVPPAPPAAIEPSPPASVLAQPAVDTSVHPEAPPRFSGNAHLIDTIQPEPLVLAHRPQSQQGARLWRLGSLAAALLAVIQLGAIQIHAWRFEQPFAPLYAVACQWVQCPEVQRVDTAKIVTAKLLVRSHPTAANALQLDAIIINKAPFEQPFPPLVLSFLTLNNQLLAERVFQPEEYLGGELTGQTLFPSQQEVHIAFEIKDPGKEAVGYSLVVLQ